MSSQDNPFEGVYELQHRLDPPDGDVQAAAEAGVADRLALLAAVANDEAPPTVRLTRPVATAAFSRRDALLPGYPAAVDAARARGFAAVVRPVGGRLAPYHSGCLVVDVVGRAADVRSCVLQRFQIFAGALAASLCGVGLDARVGEIPDEYCPGRHSVNIGGRVKVAGTAQRQVRGGFLLSAVVTVEDTAPLADLVGAAYAALGLPVATATVGGLAEIRPDLTLERVAELVVEACGTFLSLREPSPQPVGEDLGGEVFAAS